MIGNRHIYSAMYPAPNILEIASDAPTRSLPGPVTLIPMAYTFRVIWGFKVVLVTLNYFVESLSCPPLYPGPGALRDSY